jgi:hypothetical protein
MPNKSSNPTEVAEFLFQVWKEQYSAARRYLAAALKGKSTRDRLRVEGVNFLLLSLREHLVTIPLFKAHVRDVEADYVKFVDLLTHF